MPEQPREPDPKPQAPHPHPFDGRVILWLLTFFVLYYIIFSSSGERPETISYTAFKTAVENSRVESVTFKGERINGRYNDQSGTDAKFTTIVPDIDDIGLYSLLQQQQVEIIAESTQQAPWATVLLGFIPWLFIIAMVIYSSRVLQKRMGGGGPGGMFGFSKSKARLFETTDNDISYEDVAGADSAKQDLLEIVEFLKNPEKFQKLGAKMPRGILLMGPPGTGKTLLAKATAHEAGVPFFSISGSEFIEMFVGVGASRVRDMFKDARAKAPALIFIDEIDSVGRVRGTGLGGGNDEREQTLNQVLAEMDGFSAEEVVVVLAATNRPDVLDPALLRPGRFDRKVTLELPQQQAREDILAVHSRKVPLAEDVKLDELARVSIGFSGADLANLVNEAALQAARNNREQVTQEDFNKAHDKIIMGSERQDLLNPNERRRTAIHESGHAITALFLPESDPLRQVSIIPRGRSLGATEQMPEEDRHNYSQSYVETRLAVMLGGRCAERLVLGDISSGAANDLEQATHLAKLMVTQWGMSDIIGPVHYKTGSEHPFLGYELTQEKDYSEQTARTIDEEVKRIVSDAQTLAEKTLTEHCDALQKLIEGLLQHETLDKQAIDGLLLPATSEATSPATS